MKLITFLFIFAFILNGISSESLRAKVTENSKNKRVCTGNPDAEACVACRFIWENIGEAIGNESRNSVIAAEAFQYFCKISPDVFFNPVQIETNKV